MPKLDRVPKIKRYCTNCKQTYEVRFDNNDVCPVCQEETLMPAPKEIKHEQE